MTTQPAPQCLVCKHWTSPLDRSDDNAAQPEPTQVCAAFPLPEGIPDTIWHNQADHRQPYDGDHGIGWESDGDPFPDWAMASNRGGG